MKHSNSFTFNITGTSFGSVNKLPVSKYLYGGVFSDILGNTTVFTDYISGGQLIPSQIENESDLIEVAGSPVFWIDINNITSLSFGQNNNNIVKIKDSTFNQHEFIGVNTSFDDTTARWFEGPILEDTNYWSVSHIPDNQFKHCLRMTGSNYLACSSIQFNTMSAFTVYAVWYDNNYNKIENRKSIPFSLSINTPPADSIPTLSSEYFLSTDYDSITAQVIYGMRDETVAGEKIENLSSFYFDYDVMSRPNLIKITYDGTRSLDLSTQNLFINNNLGISADRYFIGGDPLTLPGTGSSTPFGFIDPVITTNIGYSSLDIINDFYICEIIAFDKAIEPLLNRYIVNYLVSKWQLPGTLLFPTFSGDSSTFKEPLSNLTYQDAGLVATNITIPVQSCRTDLIISFSGFDESVSKVLDIAYSYNGNNINVNIPIQNQGLSAYGITLPLEPDSLSQETSYDATIYVTMLDSTIYNFKINGKIMKCGVFESWGNVSLIDSQLLQSIDDNLLILEDTATNQVFVNKLNTSTTAEIITGGDIVSLTNTFEFEAIESIFLLDEALEVDDEVVPLYETPPVVPISLPTINPIKPLPY